MSLKYFSDRINERNEKMREFTRLGFNSKLVLYKTAYLPLADCYVGIKDAVIYETRHGEKFPLLKCTVAGGDRFYWFREEELTNFVL